MKLEPVYLLAPRAEPRPDPRLRVTRRRFMVAMAAAVSAGIGFAGGMVVGRSGREVPAADEAAPDTDAFVVWALELQDGPIEAFVASSGTFVWVLANRPAHRAELWRGVERLALRVLESGAMAEVRRSDLAGVLVQTLDGYEHPTELDRLRGRLRRLAR